MSRLLPCLLRRSRNPRKAYILLGGVAGAAVVVFGFALCRRGFGFIAAPVGVKLTDIFSPGTLVSQSLSPTFFARSDIAGFGGGAVELGGAAILTIIIVTAAE